MVNSTVTSTTTIATTFSQTNGEKGDDAKTTSTRAFTLLSTSKPTNTTTKMTMKLFIQHKPTKITPTDRSIALAQSRVLPDETITSFQPILSSQSDINNDNSNTIAMSKNKNRAASSAIATKKSKHHGCQIESSKNKKRWNSDFSLEQLCEITNINDSDHFVLVNNNGECSSNSSSSGSSSSSGGGRKSHGFNYLSKHDSTIKQCDDFKRCIDKQNKMKEEMKNKPSAAF